MAKKTKATLSPAHAVLALSHAMRLLGFDPLYRSRTGSAYLRLPYPVPFRLRISDHPLPASTRRRHTFATIHDEVIGADLDALDLPARALECAIRCFVMTRLRLGLIRCGEVA